MPQTPIDRQRWPTYGSRPNIGAYEQPFSGVGMEFEPLGLPSVDTEITLHEVGYWPNNYDWNYASVYSPFWRVYYDFEPGHCVRFGDQVTALGPEKLVVIPNHRRFDCMGTPPVPKLWIHFSCRWTVEPATPMPIAIPVDVVAVSLIHQFTTLFGSQDADARSRVRRLGLAFLVYLLGDPRIPRRKHVPENIDEVVRRINGRPAYPWNNPELAKIAAMSTESFIRLFKRWTGETPIRYVQQIRVREACRLLTDTENSIEEIATQTGFPDRFYFSRVFKKHTSRSPAAYRKQTSAPEPQGNQP
jgi:AraC family transcriptional regulator of arabinose operon